MAKAEQLSVLYVVSLFRKSSEEQDAKCLGMRKVFSAVVYFVTVTFFKVDTKHPHIFQCSILMQCLRSPAFQRPL